MSVPGKALEVAVDEDLLPLSALLHQRGIAHRVFEEGGRQVLEVMQRERVEEVRELYRGWRAGDFRIEVRRNPRPGPIVAGPGSWRRAPVTMALVSLSILGFLLVYLTGLSPAVKSLTYHPVVNQGSGVALLDMGAQYWRLVTPVFLHFSWLHIAFNSLWLWDLGTRLEQVVGRLNMVMLFLVIAVVSNSAQDIFGGPSLFGGMSGVVYGLLGFSWVAPLLQPKWRIQPSNALMAFMIGWLLLCASGVVEKIGLGAIANAAHFGGLACGAALGLVFGLVSALDRDKG